MAESRTIFMTGSTGTLGKELIRTLLTKSGDKLYLLIRRGQRHTHWARARKILAAIGLEHLLGTRVQVFNGDVTLPNMGLQPYEIEELQKNADEFFHVAALTALNGSEEDCSRINIGGTIQALDLGWNLFRNGKLRRFFYYSTAYVAGSRQTYCSKEDELPAKPAFANFYESSKYAAETRVRNAMRDGLPVTIFRPSIVVGDSQTGEVSEFNVIYPFMKLFAHGILKVLPARPEHSFNIVPIDFVIQASLAISRQPESIGKCFHLVSPEPPTIGTMLQLKDELYPEMPQVELIEPENFRKEMLDAFTQQVFQMLEPYLGYLTDDLSFDMTNTRKALQGTGVAFPKTDYEFLNTLVRYAVEAGYLVVQR